MQRPKKLRPDQLQHPKSNGDVEYKRFNGETATRNKSTFGGGSRWGDQGFMSRGVHTVTPPISTETDTGRPLATPPTSLTPATPYSLFDDRQKRLHNQSLKDNEPQVFSITDRQSRLLHRKRRK